MITGHRIMLLCCLRLTFKLGFRRIVGKLRVVGLPLVMVNVSQSWNNSWIESLGEKIL